MNIAHQLALHLTTWPDGATCAAINSKSDRIGSDEIYMRFMQGGMPRFDSSTDQYTWRGSDGEWMSLPMIAVTYAGAAESALVIRKEWEDACAVIAAAPELLEALQALRLAREQDKFHSWEKGAPEFSKAEAKADAAIAKATGSDAARHEGGL